MTLEPGGFLSPVTAVCTEAAVFVSAAVFTVGVRRQRYFSPTVAKSYSRVRFLVELYLKTTYYSKNMV